MTGFAELSQGTAPTAKEIAASQITYSYDNAGNIKKVTYPTTKNGICEVQGPGSPRSRRPYEVRKQGKRDAIKQGSIAKSEK